MALLIENLNKKYDDILLYRDFNISFTEGIITCILGPSGCGKTTLLNIIGGIILPDSGNFSGFQEKTMSYIFQDPRLLKWKTVRGNIEFVMDRGMTDEERHKESDRLIKLVELKGFAGYYPSQLSGGMRQRVSIARAFACHSNIILMDEPLKGLDIALKQNMIRSFARIWKTDRRTVIFVTHDVDEAIMLGAEIMVMSRPPVSIVEHENIIELPEIRLPESDQFKNLKQKLIKALG
ncbi:MAG TPA: ATP-binding cassette domain-containing protein [Bacteroidales bacterium]|jgi:NitT/TauT family transport system ATP-binding protein|nr:ATP-binding cassette domain-containing protein [Bacteroidales bacterium]HPM88992.1 ATP-binding cassette domain-containing protein [Bacteroidales bacterium]HQM70851.1 ATP-binding cassette domain-containing protein [Bacteroidales bacterium]